MKLWYCLLNVDLLYCLLDVYVRFVYCVRESDDEYSDDDDMSWKVRRSAAKCLESVISTRHEMLISFYRVVSPALIARFKGTAHPSPSTGCRWPLTVFTAIVSQTGNCLPPPAVTPATQRLLDCDVFVGVCTGKIFID